MIPVTVDLGKNTNVVVALYKKKINEAKKSNDNPIAVMNIFLELRICLISPCDLEVLKLSK